MALPQLAAPTFTLTLPSTGEEITYRPYLVKEEKILLMAKESDEPSDMYRALKQVISNCVITPDNFDVEKIATYDLDYMFIKLRAISVNNLVDFKVKDSDDGIEYDLQVDLNDVEVQFPESKIKDGTIMLDKKIGIKMHYPSTSISEKIGDKKSIVDINLTLIEDCIDYIFDDQEVWQWNQASDKEKKEFIEMIPASAFDQIQDFFDSSPKIEHVVKYTNSNGTEKKVVFRTLDDFFVLA